MRRHCARKLTWKFTLLTSLLANTRGCFYNAFPTIYLFVISAEALFFKDCDESIHSANSLAANHQRYLATRIRVALSSKCDNKGSSKREMPAQQTPHRHVSGITSSPWAVDELLQFSDQYQSSDKREQLEFGELKWFTDMNMFGEQVKSLAAAEVPQLRISQPSSLTSYRPTKTERSDQEASS